VRGVIFEVGEKKMRNFNFHSTKKRRCTMISTNSRSEKGKGKGLYTILL